MLRKIMQTIMQCLIVVANGSQYTMSILGLYEPRKPIMKKDD